MNRNQWLLSINAKCTKKREPGHLVYLLVSQDDHGQLGRRPQQAVQLSFGQWKAASVRRVHHIHQNVSPSQVVRPVPPQVLPSTDCSRGNTKNNIWLCPSTFNSTKTLTTNVWFKIHIFKNVCGYL